jgi:hypothetical protein
MFGLERVFLYEYNLIKHIMYVHVALLFTTWNVLLLLFHRQLHSKIHLLYLTYITCVVGSYFSFYQPGYFDIQWNGTEHRLKGWKKLLFADSVHIIPFIFIYCLYSKYYLLYINAFVLLLIYTVILKVKNVYGVSFIEAFSVFIISSIFYYFVM